MMIYAIYKDPFLVPYKFSLKDVHGLFSKYFNDSYKYPPCNHVCCCGSSGMWVVEGTIDERTKSIHVPIWSLYVKTKRYSVKRQKGKISMRNALTFSVSYLSIIYFSSTYYFIADIFVLRISRMIGLGLLCFVRGNFYYNDLSHWQIQKLLSSWRWHTKMLVGFYMAIHSTVNMR